LYIIYSHLLIKQPTVSNTPICCHNSIAKYMYNDDVNLLDLV